MGKIYGTEIIGDLAVTGNINAPNLWASPADVIAKTETAKAISPAILGERMPTLLDTNYEIEVGTGGHYSRLGEALTEASKVHRVFIEEHLKAEYNSNTPYISVKLLSGFVLEEYIYMRGLSLDVVRISSVDAEVMVDWEPLETYRTNLGLDGMSAFSVAMCMAPLMVVLWKMTPGCPSTIAGILCGHNGTVYFSPYASYGFKNAGMANIYATTGGIISCVNNVCTGGGQYGALAGGGGQIYCGGANMRRVVGSSTTGDMYVRNGGQIVAHGALGGTNITPNTFTASGVIYN